MSLTIGLSIIGGIAVVLIGLGLFVEYRSGKAAERAEREERAALQRTAKAAPQGQAPTNAQ
jgi:hypothetical protein